MNIVRDFLEASWICMFQQIVQGWTSVKPDGLYIEFAVLYEQHLCLVFPCPDNLNCDTYWDPPDSAAELYLSNQ